MTGFRISKTQRLLDLTAFLAGRRTPVPVREILGGLPAYADRWRHGDETDRESVRRSFERDKRTLRQIGIPLETVEWTVDYGTRTETGYQISSQGLYLPYLRLVREEDGDDGDHERGGDRDPEPRPGSRGEGAGGPSGTVELADEDARLALEAVRQLLKIPGFPLERPARSVLRKLTFDLDPELFPETPLTVLDSGGAASHRDRLEALTRALLRRRRVEFRYHGAARGETTHRTVAPYGLFFQHGRWYLAGHDALRDDRRVFRVDRMEALEEAGESGGDAGTGPSEPCRVPDDFDVTDYLDREAWELAEDAPEAEARVRFRHPLSLEVARRELGEPVERKPGEGSVRSFRVSRPDPFLRWILSLAGEAEILEPAAWRKRLREMAREVAELYGPAAPGREEAAPERSARRAEPRVRPPERRRPERPESRKTPEGRGGGTS